MIAYLLFLLLLQHVVGFGVRITPYAVRRSALLMAEAEKVVIIGGGFGGLYTALELATTYKDSVDVTLVDSKDKFVFLPLLYELATGTASILEVAPRYEDLLQGTGVRFRQATVSSVDIGARTLALTTTKGEDEQLAFDQAVVATGAAPRTDIIPGASTHATPFSRVGDAYTLKQRLRELETSTKDKIRVTVVGGGYSGVEVASSVADYLGPDRAEVRIVDRNPCIMHTSPQHNRVTSEKRLADLGVKLIVGTSVVSIGEGSITLASRYGDGADEWQEDTDLVVLTAGIRPSALVESLTLPNTDGISMQVAGGGRLAVNSTLRCKGEGCDAFWALGDNACVVDAYGAETAVPLTAQVAMQQSAIVAANIAMVADAKAKANSNSNFDTTSDAVPLLLHLRRFSYVPLGEALTLGATDASISSLGGLLQIKGPAAAIARRLLYAARMPTNKQRATAVMASAVQSAAVLLQRGLQAQQRKKK